MVALDRLSTPRPSVYLDQWVWVRLARAAAGRPYDATDEAVLEAVRRASAAGVAFPLSTTHYIETTKVKDPRQRHNLAAVMAPVSCCRTLRGGRKLLRHQMLTAMHESFGRPTFPPKPPEVLGIVVTWAFTGEPGLLRVHGPDGVVDHSAIPGLPARLRQVNQWAEARSLSGPQDHEVETLRQQYGYRPEATTEATESRLKWESLYVGLLRNDTISRRELRVRVQARELIHEYRELFFDLLDEYRLSLDRVLGSDPARPGSARPQMVAFADRIPSMRIAVDVKVQLFRNATRTWTVNDLHDIDSLSLAVPYCHVVVADKEMAHMIRRSGADKRHGTSVLSRLDDLAAKLPSLEAAARSIGGDASGWDWLGPGARFCLDMPGQFPTTG
jgi:hypothetical protein